MGNGSAKLIHCFSGDARCRGHIGALRRGPWLLLLLHSPQRPHRRLHGLLQGSSLQGDHHLPDLPLHLHQCQHNHFSLHRPCRPHLATGHHCQPSSAPPPSPPSRSSSSLASPPGPSLAPSPSPTGIPLKTHREAAFESSTSLSSVPLQPVPRFSSWPLSGPLVPIDRDSS